MDILDRCLIGIGLVCTLVLACAIPYSVGRECKKDLENLKAELANANRDATAAEIDYQTLTRIKSIQGRLDTLYKQVEMFIDTSTDVMARDSRRIGLLEQRIDELESIIRESGQTPTPTPTPTPADRTTPPDVPATRPAAPRRRFVKFRDLEENEYFTDADGWWLVCLASIATIVAACVVAIYMSYYTLTH